MVNNMRHSISLDTIMNSIVGYKEVTKQHGFAEVGDGDLPWSRRYVNSDGIIIEFNASGWVMKDEGGIECSQGRTHKELQAYLLSSKTKEELIAMLLK